MSTYTNWEVRQPDGRFGHENCAFMSGSTGLWGDYGCHHAEFRCLCELGAQAPPTYHESMQSLGVALETAATMHRVLLAVAIVAAVGLPLLLENMWQASPRRGAAASERSESCHRPRWTTTAESSVLLHVGWGFTFGSWLTFICHYALGIWDGAFLGSWTNYTTFVPVGAILMLECAHPGYLVIPASMVLGVCALITSVSAANLYDVAARSNRYEGDIAYVFVWFGFGAVNCLCGHRLFATFLRHDLSPRMRYDIGMWAPRVIAGTSGIVLATGIAAAIVSDPKSAMQHPLSFGSIATSISWVAFGLFFTPRNRRRLLGKHSVQHWFFDLDEGAGALK